MRRHLMRGGKIDRLAPLIWYCGAKQDPAVTDRLVDLTGKGYDLTLSNVAVGSSGAVNFLRWCCCGMCKKPFVLKSFTIICRRTGFEDANGGVGDNAVVSKGDLTAYPSGAVFLYNTVRGIRMETGAGGKRACAVNDASTVIDTAFAADGISIMTNDVYYMYGSENKVRLAHGDTPDNSDKKLVVNSCLGSSSRFTLKFSLHDLIIFNHKLTEDEIKEVVETMINV